MEKNLTIINNELLTALSKTAQTLPRLRKNHNVHSQLDDPVQRLYNAMEPDTYVRPHRHADEHRWEFFQIVTGSALVLTFNDQGIVRQKLELSQSGPNIAVEIPGNQWHTIVSLQNGTVLFEIKQGPYQAVTDKDFASWAPAEGDRGTGTFVKWFREAHPGDYPPRV